MFYDFITKYTDNLVEKMREAFHIFNKNMGVHVFQILTFEILTKSLLTTSLVLNNRALIYKCDPNAELLYYSAIYQGPVVQSIVSLTSSLRGQLVKCFTTL